MTEGGTPQPSQPGWPPPGNRPPWRGPSGRYGLLLLLLIATYLMSAFITADWAGVVQLALFVITWLLALRSSRLPRRRLRVLSVVAVAGSAAAAGLALARPDDVAVAAASIWTGLLLLGTVVLIVRRILASAAVTGQSIFGAVSAYLIVGLMFAAFYAAMSQFSRLHGGHFFADGRAGNAQTFQYFSFTTLTTLGYGDFTAASSDGRALAVLEALSGQIFLATLVARLVAAFRGPRAPAAVPAEPAAPGTRPGDTQPEGTPPEAAEPGNPPPGPDPGGTPPGTAGPGARPPP